MESCNNFRIWTGETYDKAYTIDPEPSYATKWRILLSEYQNFSH